MWSALLVAHATAALLLLGALTHQSASVLWPATPKKGIISSFAAVRAKAYTASIIFLFLLTFILGSIAYTNYRYTVRPVLEDLGQLSLIGLFEIKEHVLAIMCGILPVYWWAWRILPLGEGRRTRAGLTLLLTVSVWFSWVVGHVLNNARGLH